MGHSSNRPSLQKSAEIILARTEVRLPDLLLWRLPPNAPELRYPIRVGLYLPALPSANGIGTYPNTTSELIVGLVEAFSELGYLYCFHAVTLPHLYPFVNPAQSQLRRSFGVLNFSHNRHAGGGYALSLSPAAPLPSGSSRLPSGPTLLCW